MFNISLRNLPILKSNRRLRSLQAAMPLEHIVAITDDCISILSQFFAIEVKASS
jgi:hypothetical protein